ncbi:unnamed protein product [Diamesa hyperborea]
MYNKYKTVLTLLVLLIVIKVQAKQHNDHNNHKPIGLRHNRNSGKFNSTLTDLEQTHNDYLEKDDNTYHNEDDNDGEDTEISTNTASSRVTSLPNINLKQNEESKPQFSNRNQLNRLVVKPSGNMVKMRCAAKGNPEPSIKWTRNGTEIVRKLGQVQYTKFGITLEDLVPSDSGIYMCEVCNTQGCINFSTKLEVKDRVNHRPIIKNITPNTTELVGSTVNISCEILSDLHPAIEWVFGAENDRKKIQVMGRDEENAEVLRLENVTEADSGWYTCLATNTLGGTSASSYLQVVDKFEDPTIKKLPSKNWVYYLAFIFSGFFVIASIVVLVVMRKLKNEKKRHRAMERVNQWKKKVIIIQPPIDPSNPGMSDSLQMPIVKIEKHALTMAQNPNNSTMMSEYEFPIDLNWEFPRSQLLLGKNLGEGAFGKVVMAEAVGLMKSSSSTVVAVKMLKDGHTDDDVKDLVCEMEVMKIIGKHINIINLVACCSQDGPLLVIVEYAPHGNLRDFLRKYRPSNYEENANEKERQVLTQKNLVSYAYQIARGMEYLASRKCIHRDLAARNVLVSDDFVMKIADFGLARHIYDQDYYRKQTEGKLPIKWLAPESLFDKIYDTQSDVWSYGILLWEIMTLGGTPYPSVPSVKNLLDLLKKGERMEKPTLCSLDMYMLMRECWHWVPSQRPTFSEIVEHLDRILSITANEEYLDLGLPQLETPPSSCDEDSDADSDGKDEFPFLM